MGGERLILCYNGKSFPSVSVTGGRCAQMCEHCRGRHLSGMTATETLDSLLAEARRTKAFGGSGLLISGGADTGGRVPVADHADAIGRIVSEGLEVNVHAGFIDREEAERLVRSGVTRFSVDVHQDREIIRDFMHLDKEPEDYGRLIDTIREAGGIPVPHITLGFGEKDLFLSLRLLESKGMKDIIVLALVPTPGTVTEGSTMNEDAVAGAIMMMSATGFSVTLGCMRDRTLRGLEIKCIQAGARRIANPSAGTVRWAEENGFSVETDPRCCCMGI
ncbi:MAG: radical SAM protein [Candidatus Methanomethylophilaceae archaeon]|nr:radical SAM protein [Candidatus Methanomethylophilaceae archaeon]MDI9378949.1 radical SAM protein [Candidatus Thermoplasmatota archaeon]MDD2778964.1 radical SAM protein [Candidatus Methanomethylophilaceae archaeon]MDD3127952.1 radical SAM protein [Candidatus Methanomethylophilaceae archaeon]MDD4119657.1 radical SAM protein [Candidatus Methanomethylophilaceae archaeon]